MTERRSSVERRVRSLPELIEQRQRRAKDRRESPRLPAPFEVHAPECECERAQGDLGLGGASWVTERPPPGDQVVITCRVPTLGREFAANAQVIRRERHGAKTLVHVAFQPLPLELECALARWLDGWP